MVWGVEPKRQPLTSRAKKGACLLPPCRLPTCVDPKKLRPKRALALSARLHIAAPMSTGSPPAAAARASSASSALTARAVTAWYAASPEEWKSGCSAARELLQ